MSESEELGDLIITDQSKKNKTRTLNEKRDVYWKHGKLLQGADRGREGIDRMLAVIKFVLTYFTDILRPSEDFSDTPINFLGSHYMSHRDIENLPNGDYDKLMIQEICTFDSEEYLRNRQYPGMEISKMHIKLLPLIKAKRGGFFSKSLMLKIKFLGQSRIDLFRHKEIYEFNYPKIHFAEPLAKHCPLAITGKLVIKCPSNGLYCKLTIEFDGTASGSVNRLVGNGSEIACYLGGSLYNKIDILDTVTKVSKHKLFQGNEERRAILKKINLSKIGGMQLPKIWTMIHDAIIYYKPKDVFSKAEDKFSKELIQMMKSLVYQEANEFNKNRNSDSEEEEEEEQVDENLKVKEERDLREMPPCIKEAHKNGKAMHYQIEYKMKVLDMDENIYSKAYIPPHHTNLDSLEYINKQKEAS